MTFIPLPSELEIKNDIGNPVPTSNSNIDVALSTRLKPADTLAGITTVGSLTSITNTVTVTGPLTDTQLRATAVPISHANLDVALSTRLKPADTLAGVTLVGAVTSITNSVAITNASLDVALSTRTKPSDNQNIKLADTDQLDAFGRLRIAEPYTLFDNQLEYDLNPLWFTGVITGVGASSTHLPNESAVLMTVGTVSGEIVIRQTREYFKYQAGKSLLINFTRVYGAAKTNVRKRCGYFDSHNGWFFEQTGTDFAVVQRTYTSGSVVDTGANRIPQTAWNLDKLDGTGPSGITLDVTKNNLYIIDLQWLGTGRVRYGVFMNGAIIYCHQFNNSNILSTPETTTANLPLRNEIENTGTAASPTSLKVVCSTIISEGGYEETKGIPQEASNEINTRSVGTAGVPVLSIRHKATFNSIVNRVKILLNHADLYITSGDAYFEIILGGTIGGTPVWNSVGANSCMEFDVAGTTITGGEIIASGFMSSTTGRTVENVIESKLPIGLDLAGANPINVSVLCKAFTGTVNISSALAWLELR